MDTMLSYRQYTVNHVLGRVHAASGARYRVCTVDNEAPAAPEDLDELYESLASDLGVLVSLGERVLAEMEAIEELRLGREQNGGQLLAARRVRRAAIVSRTQAIELCRQARDTHQRALDLAGKLESATFQARTLVSAREPDRSA